MTETRSANTHEERSLEATFGPVPGPQRRPSGEAPATPFRTPWVEPPEEVTIPKEIFEREGSLALGVATGFVFGFFALLVGRFTKAKALTRSGMWVGFGLRMAFSVIKAVLQAHTP